MSEQQPHGGTSGPHDGQQSWPGGGSQPQGSQPGASQPGGPSGPPPPGGYGQPAPSYGHRPVPGYPPPPGQGAGPGGPGGGPGGPGGWTPGGQPPKGGGTNKLVWIVLAAIAGLLVLALVIVVAVVAGGGDDDDTAASGGAPAASEAKTQSDVVKGYLTALAAGDAKKALSYASSSPLNKDFLTDEVLAESAKTAKISDIKVAKADSEYSSTVAASFNVGDQSVTQDFSVTKSGDSWRLRDAGSDLDFTSMRKNTLPLLINGKQLESDKVMLFPGTYTVTTGSENISYGESGQFTVKSNADYVSSADLQPTLTPAGQKAYVAAVKASTRTCLGKTELQPRNCPNRVTSRSYQIDKGTVRWQRVGSDPFANLKPRLDYDNPNVATSRPNLQLQVTASCNSGSGKCSAKTYSYGEATVDMTKSPLVVRWATS